MMSRLNGPPCIDTLAIAELTINRTVFKLSRNKDWVRNELYGLTRVFAAQSVFRLTAVDGITLGLNGL